MKASEEMGGRLIGELSGLTTLSTNFFLTDALGSVVAAFSNTKGAAALNDNQVYGPYGNLLYSANGTMGTAKGYTGQYSDPLTGLDYDVARYYDPVAGVFLSADVKEGNAQGMNPYAYVAANPETLTDPSGQMIDCGPGCGNGTPPPPPNHGPVPCTWQGCQDGNSGSSGNNPSPTKLKVNLPSGCSGLNPEQCSRGTKAQQNSENHDLFMLRLFELLVGIANVALDGYNLWKDFSGWSITSALKWIGDVISAIGDLAYFVGLAGSIFHVSWLESFANGISVFVNLAGGVYKAIKAATSSLWVMGIIIAGYYTIKAAFSEGDIGLEAEQALAYVAEKVVGDDVVANGVSSILNFAEAGVSYWQNQYDATSNESPSQFCRINPTQCQ